MEILHTVSILTIHIFSIRRINTMIALWLTGVLFVSAGMYLYYVCVNLFQGFKSGAFCLADLDPPEHTIIGIQIDIFKTEHRIIKHENRINTIIAVGSLFFCQII